MEERVRIVKSIYSSTGMEEIKTKDPCLRLRDTHARANKLSSFNVV